MDAGLGVVRKHYFVDEAGNFDFSRKPSASRYFILTSVTMEDCHQTKALLDLRRELAWNGHELTDAFHATTDKQRVRDRVFELIAAMDIHVDATIFEKSKTIPARQNDLPFYKLAWYHHAKSTVPSRVMHGEELHVIAASLKTKNEQKAIASGIEDVIVQTGRQLTDSKVHYWPASTDPCLQVADYCCWAIQRKWERQDSRSHELIAHLIRSEYDMWGHNPHHQY